MIFHLNVQDSNSAFHPSVIDKWVPASAGKPKAGMDVRNLDFFIRPAMWSVASQVSTGCNCPFLNPYRQPNLTLSASMRCGPDVTVVTAHLQCFHRSNGDAQWQLRRRSNPAALCCSQRTDQIRSVAYCCARKTGLPLNARCVHSIDSLMKPFQLS